MKKKGILTLTSVYAVIMLFILICSVSILATSMKRNGSVAPRDTEYVYVYVTQESEDIFSENIIKETDSVSIGWIVKEYCGQIGIFSTEGTLLYVLDTYVKTLPEADRRLLGEGIRIDSKAELLSIVEDYTS